MDRDGRKKCGKCCWWYLTLSLDATSSCCSTFCFSSLMAPSFAKMIWFCSLTSISCFFKLSISFLNVSFSFSLEANSLWRGGGGKQEHMVMRQQLAAVKVWGETQGHLTWYLLTFSIFQFSLRTRLTKWTYRYTYDEHQINTDLHLWHCNTDIVINLIVSCKCCLYSRNKGSYFVIWSPTKSLQ